MQSHERSGLPRALPLIQGRIRIEAIPGVPAMLHPPALAKAAYPYGCFFTIFISP